MVQTTPPTINHPSIHGAIFCKKDKQPEREEVRMYVRHGLLWFGSGMPILVEAINSCNERPWLACKCTLAHFRSSKKLLLLLLLLMLRTLVFLVLLTLFMFLLECWRSPKLENHYHHHDTSTCVFKKYVHVLSGLIVHWTWPVWFSHSMTEDNKLVASQGSQSHLLHRAFQAWLHKMSYHRFATVGTKKSQVLMLVGFWQHWRTHLYVVDGRPRLRPNIFKLDDGSELSMYVRV